MYNNQFSDVDNNNKYYKYVKWLANVETKNNSYIEIEKSQCKPIINGYKDGEFKLERKVNRAEMAKITMNLIYFFGDDFQNDNIDSNNDGKIDNCREKRLIEQEANSSLQNYTIQNTSYTLQNEPTANEEILYTTLGDSFEQKIALEADGNNPPGEFKLFENENKTVKDNFPVIMPEEGLIQKFDTDGDQLNYLWHASGGRFKTRDFENHSQVLWYPPVVSEEQVFQIHVYRGDGEGHETHDIFDVTVEPSGEVVPPTPTSITLTANLEPNVVNAGGEVVASGQAVYNTGDPVKFAAVTIGNKGQTQTLSDGSFNTNIFASGASEEITVTVKDGQGLTASQTKDLTVEYVPKDQFTIYEDDFESGLRSNYWSTKNIQGTSTIGIKEIDGSSQLTIENRSKSQFKAYFDLTLDLSEESKAQMTFDYDFTSEYGGTAAYLMFSADGKNFSTKRVTLPKHWHKKELNLVEIARDAGINLTSEFTIRFQVSGKSQYTGTTRLNIDNLIITRGKPSFAVDPNRVNFGSSAGEQSVAKVFTNINEWSIANESEIPSWLRVKPFVEADVLEISTTQDNEEFSKREFQILLDGNGLSEAQITVTQNGLSPYIYLTPQQKTVNSKTQEQVLFQVNTNLDEWEVYTKDNPDWVSVERQGDFVIGQIQKNTGENNRSVDIKIEGTLNGKTTLANFNLSQTPANTWENTEELFTLSDNPDWYHYLLEPDIFVEPNGKIHTVAVAKEGTDKPNGDHEFRHQLLYRQRTGSVWGGQTAAVKETRIYHDSNFTERAFVAPDVFADKDGRVFIAYQLEERNGQENIYLIEKTGFSGFSKPVKVSQGSISRGPVVTVDKMGTVYVFWRSKNADSTYSPHYRTRVNGKWSKIAVLPKEFSVGINAYYSATDNKVHLVARDQAGSVYYANLSNNNLSNPEKLADSTEGSFNSLKIHEFNNQLVISTGDQKVNLFTKENNQWQRIESVVELSNSAESGYPLWQDASGLIHSIYRDGTLVESIFSGSSWTPGVSIADVPSEGNYAMAGNDTLEAAIWQYNYQIHFTAMEHATGSAELEVSPTELTIDQSETGTLEFNVTNPSDGALAWSVASEADWLKVESPEGAYLNDGKAVLRYNVDGITTKEATVKVTANNGSLEKIVTVKVGPNLNQLPELEFTSPKIAAYSSSDYLLSWIDQNTEEDAKISLYYDNDQEGADGTLIVENLSEDDASNEYLWDTSQLEIGQYFIYAVVDDGVNVPVTVYASGSINKRDNLNETYGDGSDGDFIVKSGETKSLDLNKIHQFKSFIVEEGGTLTTGSTIGSAMYVLVQEEARIDGEIILKDRLQPGQSNFNLTSEDGRVISNPGVASGGNANMGGRGGEGSKDGYGGGGNGGGYYQKDYYSNYYGGLGGNGGKPGGLGGVSKSLVKPNGKNWSAIDGEFLTGANGGVSSGGGGGAWGYYDRYNITLYPGKGGDAYGQVGANGYISRNNIYPYNRGRYKYLNSGHEGWAAGGGGAGGEAGKAGVNFVLKADQIIFTGTIDTSGSTGGKGGDGGKGRYVRAWVVRYDTLDWEYGCAEGYHGFGGGGGGGGNAGNIEFYYNETLYDQGVRSMNGGGGGAGGLGPSIGSTRVYPDFDNCRMYESYNKGHSGKPGVFIDNGAAQVSFTHPGQTPAYANEELAIRWVDEYVQGEATISLYYDTDNEGANGTLIAGGISEDDETDEYLWDTSKLANGEYYLYAVIDDGKTMPRTFYSENKVVIDHSMQGKAPQITILNPDQFENPEVDISYAIKWSAEDEDSDGQISLYYDTDNDGIGGKLIVENLSEDAEIDEYTWDTTRVIEGEYYVYATIKDESNPKITAVSKGKVRITHPDWQLVGSEHFTALTNRQSKSDIAIDNNNVPYVIIDDQDYQNRLSVMHLDGQNWAYVGQRGLSSALAQNLILKFAPDNTPHIAFTENNRVIVKKFDGQNWINVALDSLPAENVGAISLEFDKQGVLHLSLVKFSDYRFVHLYKYQDQVWQELEKYTTSQYNYQVVDSILKFNSINKPVLALKIKENDRNPNYIIQLAHLKNTLWENLAQLGRSNAIYNYDLVIDSSDNAYIAYGNRLLRYQYGRPVYSNNIELVKYIESEQKKLSIKSNLDELMGGYRNLNLAISNEDTLFYVADNGGRAKIAELKSGETTWQYAGENISSQAADRLQLAVDQFGEPYLLYTEYLEGKYLLTAKRRSDKVSGYPEIKLLTPNSSLNTAHQEFEIRWADRDADDNAQISLYYDTDNEGADGTLIAQNIAEDDTSDSYLWDTTNLPEEEYYLYAIIEDQEFGQFIDYSDQALTISHAVYDWQPVGEGLISPGAASDTQIKITSNDTIYTAFINEDSKTPEVQKYASGTWTKVGNLRQFNEKAENISLALDNNDVLYLAYHHPDNTAKVSIVQFTGSKWQKFPELDLTQKNLKNVLLKFNNNNVLTLGYVYAYQSNDRLLRVATEQYVAGKWKSLGSNGLWIEETYNNEFDLEFNSNNTPFVIYKKFRSSHQARMRNIAQEINYWNYTAKNLSQGEAFMLDLAADKDGYIYAAYREEGHNSTNNRIVIQKYQSYPWQKLEAIDLSEKAVSEADFLDLAIDNHNVPHLAYANKEYGGKISVVKLVENNWQSVGDIVFSDQKAGFIQLAFDSQNTPYVSFQDEAGGNKAKVMHYALKNQQSPPTVKTADHYGNTKNLFEIEEGDLLRIKFLTTDPDSTSNKIKHRISIRKPSGQLIRISKTSSTRELSLTLDHFDSLGYYTITNMVIDDQDLRATTSSRVKVTEKTRRGDLTLKITNAEDDSSGPFIIKQDSVLKLKFQTTIYPKTKEDYLRHEFTIKTPSGSETIFRSSSPGELVYSFNYFNEPGQYTITDTVMDISNYRNKASASVQITVKEKADPLPPTITITDKDGNVQNPMEVPSDTTVPVKFITTDPDGSGNLQHQLKIIAPFGEKIMEFETEIGEYPTRMDFLHEPGQYTLIDTVTDDQGLTATYELKVIVLEPENIRPEIRVTAPDVTNATADQNYTITWEAEDPDDDAQIAIYYYLEGDDQNQVLIVENLSENSVSSYDWDTSSLPDGNYYLALTIDDGITAANVAFSQGYVAVEHQTAGISTKEYNALVALYKTTLGVNWTTNLGWLSTADACTWYGITCQDGHVSEINLPNNNLVNKLPYKIGDLGHLTRLNLNNNQLGSYIPTTIGELSSIKEIYLNGNAFSGEIPAEIGNLTQLNNLYLSDNQFTGSIPVEIGNLTNLFRLALSENQLTGSIPSELGNLNKLTRLYLGFNQLSGSLPPELGNMSNLHLFYLQVNQLTGEIPTELGNLFQLNQLYLNDNQLTGEIPQELTNLTELTHLFLGKNQFTGSIPAEIDNLTNLKFLAINEAGLTGEIPLEITNLANLIQLYLDNNQLTGEIPANLGNLTQLIKVYLHNNQLTGTIPTELGNLTNLTVLHLNQNQLTGQIPSAISSLTKLNSLALSHNQLTGSIPTELGNLRTLKFLYLNNNQLAGTIPTELGNLANLTYFYLGSNALTGEIPLSLQHLTKLKRLYLDYNQLEGSLPDFLGSLSQLEILHLHHNKFTGSIPASIGDLTQVNSLALSENSLTGSIPQEFGNLSSIVFLYLNDNEFTGSIPQELDNLSNLNTIYLHNNQLTGTVSDYLKSVPKHNFSGNPDLIY
jgi:Leucine-rich repeat (LRR) protein